MAALEWVHRKRPQSDENHEDGSECNAIPAKSGQRQKTKIAKNGSTPKTGRAKSEKERTRKWLTEMEFHAMDTGRHETAAVIPSAPTKATCLRGDGPRHSHVNSGITTGCFLYLLT